MENNYINCYVEGIVKYSIRIKLLDRITAQGNIINVYYLKDNKDTCIECDLIEFV